MTSERSLILRVAESLAASELDLPPIVKQWDQEPKEKPFLLVSTTFTGSTHQKLRGLELRLEIISDRCDTAEHLAATWHENLHAHIEAQAQTIANAMVSDNWQVRVWDLVDPLAESGEKNEWVVGYEYRVVLMEI